MLARVLSFCDIVYILMFTDSSLNYVLELLLIIFLQRMKLTESMMIYKYIVLLSYLYYNIMYIVYYIYNYDIHA